MNFIVTGNVTGERKIWCKNSQICHWFYINGHIVDRQFNVHKKHNWINRLRKFQYKINLHKIDLILNAILPLEMVKICAKY